MKEADARAVGEELVRLEKCEARLSALKVGVAEAPVAPPPSFWREPEILVGEIVVSFALGGLVGFLFAKR